MRKNTCEACLRFGKSCTGDIDPIKCNDIFIPKPGTKEFKAMNMKGCPPDCNPGFCDDVPEEACYRCRLEYLMERQKMEIKIEYSDGSTFTFNIPSGKISNIIMCLANQDYVEVK